MRRYKHLFFLGTLLLSLSVCGATTLEAKEPTVYSMWMSRQNIVVRTVDYCAVNLDQCKIKQVGDLTLIFTDFFCVGRTYKYGEIRAYGTKPCKSNRQKEGWETIRSQE